MKVIVIGASGNIGQTICDEISNRHEVIRVGRTSGDIRADISDQASVEAMYLKAGPVDAVVTAVGSVHFAALGEFTDETFMMGLKHKVMGQINVVLIGLKHIRDSGSFTLTSGVLNRDPIRMGTGAAAANGAIDGFVVGAAIEMQRGLRINVVSPGILDTSLERYGSWFPGHEPVAAKRVGLAYAKSIEGAITGKVIIVE